MSTICQKCGKKYTVDVNVPNWLWSSINYKGRKDSYNLLCPECIGMGLILYHACQSSRGKYAAYELIEIPRQYNNEENLNSSELYVKRVHEMAVESLSPGKYEQLLDSLTWLCRTRKINNSLPQAGNQQPHGDIPLSIVREVLEDKYDPMTELDIDELLDDMEEIAKQRHA